MPSQKPNKQIIYILIPLLITFTITLALFTLFKDSSPHLLSDLFPNFFPNTSLNSLPNSNISSFPPNYVIRVIDGDTFELYSKDKVRLICIDAPELGNSGSYKAKEFLESLVLDKEVRLEKDISESDKYGRLLRYVWVNNSFNEEIFVNKEMVGEGYANVFRYGDDTRRCGEIEG